jgi:hypothetical protein
MTKRGSEWLITLLTFSLGLFRVMEEMPNIRFENAYLVCKSYLWHNEPCGSNSKYSGHALVGL